MEEQKFLEQLESGQYSEKDLKDEILRRVYSTISVIDGLTFDSASSFQEILLRCGYNFFEALYLICGEAIVFCPLLSKRTLDFMKRFLKKEESEELKETWECQLSNMINDLDEKILLSYLQEDSERLKKVILLVQESSTSSKI